MPPDNRQIIADPAARTSRPADELMRRILGDPLPRLSIVVPVRNEEANIAALLEEFAALANQVPLDEVIYVDDGSSDRTGEILQSLKASYPFLRVLAHNRSAGQSAATWTGVKAARNELVVTIDGDGQNDPADIEQLFECFCALGQPPQPVMVMGQRQKRRDSLVRRLSSRIANGVRSSMLGDATRDTGCSLKMFHRSEFLELPYFDHMHRFLPALMNRQGIRVAHVDVSHRPRLRGTSNYGTWDRLWVGIADLIGVMWLQRRAGIEHTISEE